MMIRNHLMRLARTLRKKATVRHLRYLLVIALLGRVPALRRRYSAYFKARHLTPAAKECVFDFENQTDLRLSTPDIAYLRPFADFLGEVLRPDELTLSSHFAAYRLANSAILPRSFSVVHLPSESIQLCPDWRAERNLIKASRPRVPLHVAGAVISMRKGQHYFHFLLDQLVMLHTLLANVVEARSATILLSKGIAPYQQASYEILKQEYPTLQFLSVGDDEKVTSDELFMTCQDTGRKYLNVFADRDALRHIGEGFRAYYKVDKKPPHRLLLISRNRQKLRKLLNENELFGKLAPLGFEFVEPETLPHVNQVELFSSARLIVSACGSALTNLVFCQPGGTLITVCPEGRHEPFWFALALQMGLAHRFVSGYDLQLYDAFRVDTDRVLALVKEAL